MNRRLAANVLALLFVASAANVLGLCACLSDDMSGPHARGMGHERMATSHGHHGIATSQMVMDCCAMVKQPSARGIAKERVDLKPSVESRASVASTVEHPDLMTAAGATVPLAHRGLPTIPIYLQHLSLLI
jgi:hypothetical protein